MSTWFLGGAILLALLGASAVIAFEAPTRSAGGLITAFVGVAIACGALGAPLVPGFILWVGAGAIGLLLLAAVLLLNLGEDERGPRRLRLRPAVGGPILAILWAALTAPLLQALPDPGAPPDGPAPSSPALTSAAVAHAVVDDLALPFTVGLLALASALVVAIALVRRRT